MFSANKIKLLKERNFEKNRINNIVPNNYKLLKINSEFSIFDFRQFYFRNSMYIEKKNC